MPRTTADGMIQSAVRLPRALHERLKQVGGERGMGEEIRRRLQASFDVEKAPDDPSTEQLKLAISSIANAVSIDAPWSTDAYSFAIFKAAVDALLAHFKPKGDPAPAPRLVFGPDDPPDTIGRTLASTTLRDITKRSFADEEKRR
jgi:hypothetical protein